MTVERRPCHITLGMSMNIYELLVVLGLVNRVYASNLVDFNRSVLAFSSSFIEADTAWGTKNLN